MWRSGLFWGLFGLGIAAAAAGLVAVGWRLAAGAWPPTAWSALLLGALASIVVAALLAWRTAGRVLRPLENLTRAADAVSSGEGVRRAQVAGGGEVGRLSRAFDRMAEELARRLDTIMTERNRMEAVLEGMVEGVVAIDRQERIVHMNRVAERLLRVSAPPTPGRPIWEVTRRAEVVELLDRAMESGEKVRGELDPAGGSEGRAVDMEASPLRDARGGIAGAVIVLHDVTELRALERVRRDFVANVSHELKTPLTAIRGIVETMVDEPEMDSAVRRRFLARVQDQCARLSSLVVDLLALSRLESGGAPEHFPLDLAALVRECAKEHQQDADAAGLALEIRTGAQPVMVEGDAEDLRTLLTNLIGNAIQYTPPGGRITLTVERDAAQARVEVADTGIGIEPRHLERIFERFYRVDKARSRELGGTGLGLSIVKHIARAHHGDVEVESTPGSGTTFRVRLPIAREA